MPNVGHDTGLERITKYEDAGQCEGLAVLLEQRSVDF